MAFNFAKLGTIFAKLKDVSSQAGAAASKWLPVLMLTFIIFVLVSLYVIQQVKVTGPIHDNLVELSDLRADVLPPPLSALGSWAILNEANLAAKVGDIAKRDANLEQAAKLKKDFMVRAAYWRASLKDKELRNLMEATITSGVTYYQIVNNEYEPAVRSGGKIDVEKPLLALEAAYVAHQKAATEFVNLLETRNDNLTYSSKRLVDIYTIVLIALALGILVFMYLFGRRQIASVVSATGKLELDSQNNQEAILNLLDEMGDLADGDLTVKAQVTESITGAIADSINYTITNLRDLVTNINRATEQVNKATGQAQSTSSSLLAAAEQQTKQIADTSTAVTNMTRSILQVSSNAGQAAQVAQRSLQAASQGALAVRNSITGMNEIRTQIQETSKRIKRLGESTQEISEIVELISDITEQTNILALNAAIQAASAGEAGRGFTVVAEEVQRLAERSSEATKQISAIVKTIQTDTGGAVAAMEKSTEGVVEGARLSDAAGQALNEIETVTNNLAQLIQAISTATAAQTEATSIVSRNMQQIQSITTQTTDGTKQTAQSVGQLTSLAAELSNSVAGFKLS
jgi:twitching motility protein PilJ